MKPEPHFLPPRSSVIFGHTRRMLDSTAMCIRKFSMVVAERYMALTAPDRRQVPFRWGVTIDDLCKAERHNAQILGRYMDGTLKTFPADLEDAWVLALPEDVRNACERDLARRRGRLSFEVPANLAGEDCGAMGDVLQQAGEMCSEWGRSIADGEVTEAEAHRICNEGDDVISAVLKAQRHVRERRARGSAATR